MAELSLASSLLGSRSTTASNGAFASAPVSAPSSRFSTSHVQFHVPRQSMPLQWQSSSKTQLATSSSSSLSLQEQIIQGATLRILNKEASDATVSATPPKQVPRETENTNEEQYSYYVREGQRSGEYMRYMEWFLFSYHNVYF